jgi:hypothetical protein
VRNLVSNIKEGTQTEGVRDQGAEENIVACTGGTRDGMTGSSSDDWILLALWLQPLVVTLHHSAIAVPHTLHSLHTNPLSPYLHSKFTAIAPIPTSSSSMYSETAVNHAWPPPS